MADNHDFLEPVGDAPDGTVKRTIRAPEIGGVLHPVAILVDSTGAAIAPATEATLANGVGLRSDDNAQHGIFTLSATPNTVTSIALPSWARIAVLSDATQRVNWRVDADPAVPGTNALTNGGSVAAGADVAIILRPGAATLRLSSQIASASVRVTVRGNAS